MLVVLASLHGVLRLAVRSWRASSLNLRRDLLPVAFSLVGSRDNSPSRLVVIPRVPFSPRRDASSSSSLLVGIHRARLLSLLRFLVFASSHHDSSCSPLRASYESRGSWCLCHCGLFSVFDVLMILVAPAPALRLSMLRNSQVQCCHGRNADVVSTCNASTCNTASVS